MFDYNYSELYVKMIILVVLQTMVHYYPDIKKYNNDTKFNYYRSIMCFAFSMIGLDIGINHFKNGFMHPFSFKHNDLNEIQYIFMAYLIVDILKLLADKNTRIDLYAHHILCIITIIIANMNNKFGYMNAIVLIAESISIVTGIDTMAMEEGDNKLSYYCKKYRKYIIKYVRMPLWVILLCILIKYMNKIDKVLWWNYVITILGLFGLDIYWESKCNKVIEKHEDNDHAVDI